MSNLLYVKCWLKPLELFCVALSKLSVGHQVVITVQAFEKKSQGRKCFIVTDLPSGKHRAWYLIGYRGKEKGKDRKEKHISEFLKQLSFYKT